MRGVVVADTNSDGSPGPRCLPRWPSLAPIANATLLRRAIATLARAGADSVVVITDQRAGPRLRLNVVDDPALPVEWITLPGRLGVGEALLAAADHLGDEPFIVHTTEGLWLTGEDRLLSALRGATGEALVYLRAEPRRTRSRAQAGGGSVATGPPGAGQLELSGVHAFGGPAILDVLREQRAETGRARLSIAIATMIEAGGDVQLGVADGWWSYDATADSLLAGNRLALDALEVPVAVRAGDGNKIAGRVEIAPTAQVIGSAISGPVVIGEGARVVDAYVGPYTAVGADAAVENSEVESSILLAGARVENVGVPLRDSIVGLGARVGRDFGLPRAMRVHIGDDASITL